VRVLKIIKYGLRARNYFCNKEGLLTTRLESVGIGKGLTQWVMKQGGSTGQGLQVLFHKQRICMEIVSPFPSLFVSNWDPFTQLYCTYVL
jgi:hypothetical protein